MGSFTRYSRGREGTLICYPIAWGSPTDCYEGGGGSQTRLILCYVKGEWPL